ncbi:hypothetical protein EW146_g5335 [Bondarzewia mesenterica]|uniref:BRCT domain-containing protein n=1 Tax=Bondarzewia mesenterica TaxID=1095465 RepID=A0A4S4LRT5_9AGAM|nr:hypothetical protein EW146_g5335 [Bondarzewia mesenterica]
MPLFEGITYYISPSGTPEHRLANSRLLEVNGAPPAPLTEATYIITDVFDFEGWSSIRKDAKVVTEYWLERTILLGKVQPAQYYSPDPAMLFSGVVACASDLSTSDLEVLSAGITALGGQWRPGLTREVTHLFALAPGSEKYQTAMHYKADTLVKSGIRIEGVGASSAEGLKARITGEKKTLYKTALMSPGQEPHPESADTRNVWQGRRILLCLDLDLADGRKGAVEAGIARAGGIIVHGNANDEVDEIQEVDILIARYRWGDAYVKAVRDNKIIGTLSWIFHVQTTGIITSPTAQLLHYPIPKKSIEEFASHEITVTNYTGESREYLKKLITLMGATFTPSMSGRNTVLIAAYISGNKTTKAGNWSIPVVNHIWLEDCFIQWKNITVGKEKYITFTPGVNFSNMLGERGIGRSMIQEGLLELEEEMELAKRPFPENQEENLPPAASGISAREVEDVIRVVETMHVDQPVDEAMDVDAQPVVGAMNVGDQPVVELEVPTKSGDRIADINGQQAEESERQPRRRARTSSVASELRRSSRKKNQVSGLDSNAPDSEEPTSPMKETSAKPKTPVRPFQAARTSLVPMRFPNDAQDDEDAGSGLGSGSEASIPKALRSRKDASKNMPRSKPAAPFRSTGDELTKDITAGPLELRKNGESSKSSKTPSTPKTTPKSSTKTPRKTVSVLLPPIGTGEALLSASSKRLGRTASASSSKAKAPPPEPALATADHSNSASPVPKRSKQRLSMADLSLIDNTPSTSRVTGRRSAADKATRRLRDEIMPDVVNFQKEMKRGHVRVVGEEERKGARDVKGKGKELPEAEIREAKEQEFEKISMARKRMKLRQEEDESADEDERERKKRRVSISSGKGKAKANVDEERQGGGSKDEGRQAKEINVVKLGRKQASKDVPLDEGEPSPKRRRISLVKGDVVLDESGEGGRRPRLVAKARSKRKATPEAEDTEQVGKVQSTSRHDSSRGAVVDASVRVLTTQIQLGDELEIDQGLIKLGAKMATRPAECTHLVVKNLGRTEKFLCAMAAAPYVVTEKWVIASIAAKQLLPPDKYLLVDVENEKKYGFKLSDAIRGAKENGGRLFADMVFFVTPKVAVDKKLLSNVVAAHGGQIRTQTPTVRVLNSKSKRFVVSCPEDVSIWRPLSQGGYKIFSQELLLNGALTQQLLWDKQEYLVRSQSQ